jgi:Tol biopolymer transport system component
MTHANLSIAALAFAAVHALSVNAAPAPSTDKAGAMKAAAPATAKSAAPKRYTIEQFMATTAMRGASFSADESRILVTSNQTGIFNLYDMPAAGGAPKALTESKTSTTISIGYFPNDDRILFTRDKDGDENNHLFVREKDGSEKDLTPGAKLKAEFLSWKRDGSAFYVVTNERDPKFFDVYRYDAKTYERALLYKNEQPLQAEAISDDEQWIAFNKTNTTNDSDVYLYSAASKDFKHITPHQGVAAHSAQMFDPASKRLFYTTNAGGEFARLVAYDLASGTARDHEKADWDIAFTYFSRDGRYRVTGVNEDGATTVRIVQVAAAARARSLCPSYRPAKSAGSRFQKAAARWRFI